MRDLSAHVVMFDAGLTLTTCLQVPGSRDADDTPSVRKRPGRLEPLKLKFNEEDNEEDEDLVSGKQEEILCDWLLVERFKYVRLLI